MWLAETLAPIRPNHEKIHIRGDLADWKYDPHAKVCLVVLPGVLQWLSVLGPFSAQYIRLWYSHSLASETCYCLWHCGWEVACGTWVTIHERHGWKAFETGSGTVGRKWALTWYILKISLFHVVFVNCRICELSLHCQLFVSFNITVCLPLLKWTR